jgi:hypothetical protein
MRKEYASELTKEFLIKAGVKAVDLENCRVYGEQAEFTPTINAQGYLMIAVYELDDKGNKVKVPIKRHLNGGNKLYDSYVYRQKIISLNRLL